MGWDKGRYYTRSKKVNGRVLREYIGVGPVAAAVAQVDALQRSARLAQRDVLKVEQAEAEAVEADLKAFLELTDLAVRAALTGAGFHQHKRGEWRKRRG